MLLTFISAGSRFCWAMMRLVLRDVAVMIFAGVSNWSGRRPDGDIYGDVGGCEYSATRATFRRAFPQTQ
jgi:hypothetical protein